MCDQSGETQSDTQAKSRWTKPRFSLATLGWIALACGVAGGGVVLGVGVGEFLGSRPPPEELRWAADTNPDRVTTPLFKCLLRDQPDECQKTNREPYHADYTRPTVSVYSSSSPRPTSVRLTIKDLSDHGQARAIDYLDRHPTATWRQIIRAEDGSESNAPRRDPYRADRVLVATVTKGMNTLPGDRLLWTRVFVQPINFAFAGYTVAATDNRTVKVASLESTKTTKAELGGGPGPSVQGLETSNATISAEQAHKAVAEISEQYENLGIDITPGFLRIIRESAADGDVIGNATVALSMLTDPIMIRRTVPGLGDEPTAKELERSEELALEVVDFHISAPADGQGVEKPAISVRPVDQLPHCPLRAKVWMLYEERDIDNGRENHLEGRQSVTFREDGEPRHDVDIVPADDISPAVWSIRALAAGSELTGKAIKNGEDLAARTNGTTPRKLVFRDYQTASELVHWLKEHPGDTNLGTLSLPSPKNAIVNPTHPMVGNPAPWATVTLVPYKHTANDCPLPEVKAERQIAGK